MTRKATTSEEATAILREMVMSQSPIKAKKLREKGTSIVGPVIGLGLALAIALTPILLIIFK